MKERLSQQKSSLNPSVGHWHLSATKRGSKPEATLSSSSTMMLRFQLNGSKVSLRRFKGKAVMEFQVPLSSVLSYGPIGTSLNTDYSNASMTNYSSTVKQVYPVISPTGERGQRARAKKRARMKERSISWKPVTCRSKEKYFINPMDSANTPE